MDDLDCYLGLKTNTGCKNKGSKLLGNINKRIRLSAERDKRHSQRKNGGVKRKKHRTRKTPKRKRRSVGKNKRKHHSSKKRLSHNKRNRNRRSSRKMRH